MKKIVLFCLVLMIIFYFTNCCEKSTSPSNDTEYVGWIVGTPGIGTEYGLIWKTTDSGQNWVRQGDSLTIPLTELNAVKAVDSLTVWVVGGVSDGYATILNTVNGGNTWQRIGSRGELDNVELLGLHVVDNNTVWVVGAHGAVIMTDDGGDTWTSKADTSFSDYNITSIEIFDQHIWACGNGTGNQGGVIIHSVDGGDSWVKEAQSSFLDARGMIDISAPSDSCVWVVGHGRTILHTSDSGTNWEIQHAEVSPTWDANGITAFSKKIAWTAEDTGTIRNTTDGGVIWSEQKNKPGNAAGYYLYRVSPVNKDIVWIIGTGIGDGIILYTANGGEQWTEQNYTPDEMLNDVSFVGSPH